jgi:hypothetical protein
VASVVKGASFASGAVATALGTFPGCMSNAHSAVDGAAVDVFYSSPVQISLLPGTVAGEAAARYRFHARGWLSFTGRASAFWMRLARMALCI